MGIAISEAETVDHIDCHLCVDCVVKCPERGALTINKRNLAWVPATATVILTAAAITLATYYELPTINEHWHSIEGKNVKMLQMDGLKSIKCFGSSRSFANQMKKVSGIMGVETYVKHHRVIVYYDTTLIKEKDVKKAIFSPISGIINYKGKTLGAVRFIQTGIDHCFDANDQYYLTELLRRDTGVLAVSTQFGEPVQAKIYFDSGLSSEEKIRELIMAKELIIFNGNKRTAIETGFVVNDMSQTSGTVPANEFARLFIPETDVSFNNFEAYNNDKMSIYELPFGQVSDPEMQQWMPYLVSHASNDDGIVRIQTEFGADGPKLKIWFVKKLTTVEKINALLKSPEFTVHFPDKSVKKVKNPFRFPI
jgi:copper chaperone CopZ